MDICAEDNARRVTHCTAVHRRPEQGISHFYELALPEVQNQTNLPAAGHAHPHVNITVEMRRCKRHARDVQLVKSRGVWT